MFDFRIVVTLCGCGGRDTEVWSVQIVVCGDFRRLARGLREPMAQAHADWNRGPSPFKGAVLGLVIERPGHGYGLAFRLGDRLGPGWGVTPADIYPLLDRLERAGLVRSVAGDLRPGQRQAKVVYHPTAEGTVEFERWMKSSSRLPLIRNELMVKIAV